MCKVISVVNQKGGVGKTTTTVNVGIGLAREGKKVLLIDADPQGSLTASLGYEEPDDLRITLATIMMDVINEEEISVNVGIGLAREGKKVLLIDADPQGSLTASLGYEEPDDLRITLATIMMDVINEEEISLEDGILHHQENVDLLPANIELSALEVTMGNVMSREMIMKEYIDAIRSRYDYILIDCMPSLGMMTINALVSSDSVLIPVQAAYLPVKGLQQLIKTILTVKKRLNRKLAIEGILLTMVDFRTNYDQRRRNQSGRWYLTSPGKCRSTSGKY
ncbi:cobQ/CobB/MinD/ParA nucleotide binding domain protein [[Clostridium] nexile CAG:348]|nr:cobQ/CobB/MinD/ParA nucleotide binding domain protein [[Clostridium] nexile CAG:348]